MCAVSAVGDNFQIGFPGRHPWYNPHAPYVNPGSVGDGAQIGGLFNNPTRAEFEALKKEIEELKILLQAAKKYDEATGQPHCEQDDKVAFLKKVAEWVGVDLNEVFDAK